jgi:hypothetical protein
VTRDHQIRVAISGIKDSKRREAAKLTLLLKPHLIRGTLRRRLYHIGLGNTIRKDREQHA